MVAPMKLRGIMKRQILAVIERDGMAVRRKLCASLALEHNTTRDMPDKLVELMIDGDVLRLSGGDELYAGVNAPAIPVKIVEGGKKKWKK